MSAYPILSNTSYSTFPALSYLHSLPLDELSSMSFSIHNEHGSIEFLTKVDLRDLDLDYLVNIQKDFIEVYPEESPPIGTGLNVPARLTLNKTQTCRSSVVSQCNSMEAKLVDFDEGTGKTVFEVQHFTRFQLRWDEDEEEEEENKAHDDPVLQIPLEIESESVNSKRRFELPESVSEAENPETLSLDFSRKFKFSISPQGLVYLPSTSGALKGYRLYFENEQAIKGLDILMNQVQYGSRDFNSSPRHLECIWYRMSQIYVRDTTYIGISNEAQIWTLVNVLFGSPFVNVSDLSSNEVPFREGNFDEARIQLMRKKAFFSWLKTWKTEEYSVPTRRILLKLANGEVSQAAVEAAKTGFLYLSNLISLTPTEYTKTELQHQIELWKKANIYNSFNKNIAEIYEILAGIFEKLPDYLTWKQKLFLILQYKCLNYYGIIPGINEFESKFIENTDMKSKFNENYLDFCYLLLNFYSNPGSNFVADMLNPFGFQNHFSLGTSWLLFYSLFTIFEVSEEYAGINNDIIKAVFSKLEYLTEAFAEELVNSGKWQLAVYILKYSRNPSHVLQKIISRNVHIDDWQIDLECIAEQVPLIDLAKALHEKHSFNFLNSFNAYIESDNINLASDIAIHEIAPLYIIKYTGLTLYDKLYTGILERIVERAVELNRIVLEEEIYIDYLKIVLKIHEKQRPANDDELSRSLAKVDEVNMKILRLPRSSFNQQVAISIMQTCLNGWKLKLLETRNMMNGFIETSMLDHVDECSLEDLLRFSEMIGEYYLKSEVRV